MLNRDEPDYVGSSSARDVDFLWSSVPIPSQQRICVYHVAEDGVEVVQSRPLDGTIVAFVDGDPKNSDPQGFLTTSVSWSNPARALD